MNALGAVGKPLKANWAGVGVTIGKSGGDVGSTIVAVGRGRGVWVGRRVGAIVGADVVGRAVARSIISRGTAVSSATFTGCDAGISVGLAGAWFIVLRGVGDVLAKVVTICPVVLG